MIDKVLNLVEIKSKLEKIDSGKLPGPDGLNAYFLKKCCETLLAYPLHIIFLNSVKNSKLPGIWKRANVSPTFKSWSKLDKQNYIQVSLTVLTRIVVNVFSCMYFTYERSKCMKKNHLYSSQYGT